MKGIKATSARLNVVPRKYGPGPCCAIAESRRRTIMSSSGRAALKSGSARARTPTIAKASTICTNSRMSARHAARGGKRLCGAGKDASRYSAMRMDSVMKAPATLRVGTVPLGLIDVNHLGGASLGGMLTNCIGMFFSIATMRARCTYGHTRLPYSLSAIGVTIWCLEPAAKDTMNRTPKARHKRMSPDAGGEKHRRAYEMRL
mmetsp:Transcript_41896/g.129517  ORF Transcript_41896/g.129517 Transcript_41896/m.129517 type:complete len:203 (-) Transcript_41896:37-645(-)